MRMLQLIVVALAVCGVHAVIQARTAALHTSTTTSERIIGTENMWLNLTHVGCGGGTAAFVYMQALQRSALLVVRGFNFTVPPNATVVGIHATWTVRIMALSAVPANRTYPHEIALVGLDSTGTPPTPRWSTPRGSINIPGWTSDWSAATYPLTGDDAMWGVGAGGSLATGAGISSPLFGVAMSIDNLNFAEFDAQIACVRIEVNYTVDTPPTIPTTGIVEPAGTTGSAGTTGFAGTTGSTGTTGTTGSVQTTGIPSHTQSSTSAVVGASTIAVSKWAIVGPALGCLGCFVFVAWSTTRYLGWRKERALRFARGVGLQISHAVSDDSESDPGHMLDGSSDGNNSLFAMVDGDIWLDDVEISREIGSGNFGSVFLGSWNRNTEVACKTLNGDGVGSAAVEEALRLSQLNHPNIVRFFGLYRNLHRDVFIVMEYLQKGALNTFLKTADGRHLSEKDRLRVCADIAAGMYYLARQKVVHGDLSARNILVTHVEGVITAKIADFGLSLLCDRGLEGDHTMEGEQYCRVPKQMARKVAVRHAAPEIIEQGRYSSQSDAWAFGVVMWEIYSGGNMPFADMSNTDAVESVLHGDRLERPQTCPVEIYKIMLRCWNAERVLRPVFSDIRDDLVGWTRSGEEEVVYNTMDNVVDDAEDNYQNNVARGT